MTRLSLSPRDRRTLGRGILVIGAIVAIGRGWPAWKQWDADVRRRAERTIHEAALAEASLRQLRAVRDSATARAKRLSEVTPMLLAYETREEATAALAEIVSAHAQEAAVRVNYVQFRATAKSPAGEFARVAVRVDATGDVTGLTDLLQLVEDEEILLAVRELRISQPEPAAANTKPEALHIELVVEGLAALTSEKAK